jgi:hypothetical protein
VRSRESPENTSRDGGAEPGAAAAAMARGAREEAADLPGARREQVLEGEVAGPAVVADARAVM